MHQPSIPWVLLFLSRQLRPSRFPELKATSENHPALQIGWNGSRLQTDNNLFYWIGIRHWVPCQPAGLFIHGKENGIQLVAGGIVPVLLWQTVFSVAYEILTGEKFTVSHRSLLQSVPEPNLGYYYLFLPFECCILLQAWLSCWAKDGGAVFPVLHRNCELTRNTNEQGVIELWPVDCFCE